MVTTYRLHDCSYAPAISSQFQMRRKEIGSKYIPLIISIKGLGDFLWNPPNLKQNRPFNKRRNQQA